MFLDYEQTMNISPRSPLWSHARKISQCVLLCAVDCGGQLKQM